MINTSFKEFNFNFCEIVLNNDCPLNCKYCFLQNQGKRGDYISEQTLTNIFYFIKEYQIINPQPFVKLLFSLKEPLMSWNIIKNVIDNLDFKLIDYQIFITIITNGVLLTEEIYQYCRSHFIDIHISFDGPKDIHDEERIFQKENKSSYEIIMNFIKTHPYKEFLTYAITLQKKYISRTKEIFNFIAHLPISSFVFGLNFFDDWDDNDMEILYSQIKSFIDENSSFYSKKLVLVDSASTRLDLYINNGLKIFQNGEVILLPPINCVQEKSKIFNHRIKIGNVNQYKDIIIPSTFINTDSKNYKVSSNICNKDCPLLQNCQTGDKEIFVSDLLCRKTKLFIKLSNYCKGVNMTDKEYQDIRDNYCIYNAIVNLTDNCNLRCPYCFTEHNTRKIDMGTMKAAISFILKEVDRSDKKLIPSIAFFGGEPMLRYEDIIKPTIYWAEETGLVKNYNLRFTMTSNGTLFNEENLKFLSDHQVGLLLSMDGDKYTQDNQRPGVNGQSSFDMINTDLILKYYPGVTFRSAIEPRNVSHMLENYIFARNKGFKNYFITPNLYAEWTDDQLKIAMEQLACIAQVIYNDVSTDQTPLEWNDFKQTIQELFIPNEYKIDYGHCGIGTVSVGISTNGDLNGCQEHNTYIDHDIFYIGNIFTGIDKEKHKRLLSAFREKDHPVFKDNPNRCNSCEFYNHCASHFCPSYNMGNGSLIVNCKANCYWKQFVYNLALIWVQQAEIENNKKVLAYIENIVRDLKN